MLKRKYETLSIADNFMFCKVFSTNLDLSRKMIEIILDRKIKEVKSVISEKTVEITKDAKSVRLDILLDDQMGSVYNLEMQVAKEKFLNKRSRYYQSMIDLEFIEKGAPYEKLPDSIVIFLCCFDYFGQGLPIYAFKNTCHEKTDLDLNDGTLKVFVNLTADTKDCSDSVKSLFRYFNTGFASDSFTKKLDAAVDKARLHKEWRVEFMDWQANEMRHAYEKEEARMEGKNEVNAEYKAIIEMISAGASPEEVIKAGYDKEKVELCFSLRR